MMKSIILVTLITCAAGSVAQMPRLTPRGEWLLHELTLAAGCSSDATVQQVENEIVLVFEDCSVEGLQAQALQPYCYNLFWFGLEHPTQYSGLKIDETEIGWSGNQLDFMLQQPEKISIFGRDLILINDSTYRVERNGGVIVDELKTSWLESCLYRTDTLNVIATVQQWGSRWRMNDPCPPFYMEKTATDFFGSGNGWSNYGLPCERSGVLKLKTLALSDDGRFKWNWGLGNVETISAGTYTIENDSLLILQSDYASMNTFKTAYEQLHPGSSISLRYLVQKVYVIREDRIYFVNEYQP